MEKSDPLRFVKLSESGIPGFQKAWGVTRLVAELDATGLVRRELGYDALGRLVHRWPGGESPTSHSLLDPAVLDASAPGEIDPDEFEPLWQQAIEEEEFFAEHDPFGDRFGTSVPWWGCLGVVVVLAAIMYGLYRVAIRLGFAGSVSV